MSQKVLILIYDRYEKLKRKFIRAPYLASKPVRKSGTVMF